MRARRHTTLLHDCAPAVFTEPSEITRVVGLLKAKYWFSRPYLWLKKQPDSVFRVRLNP